MKKLFILLFVIAFLSPSLFAEVSTASAVGSITMAGTNWGNENRGGFWFNTASMPSDIAYFIVRPTDVSVKMFLSMLVSAKLSGLSVTVIYNKTIYLGNGKYEGDVVALTLD